jgi:hypothetical protein
LEVTKVKKAALRLCRLKLEARRVHPLAQCL